MARAKPKPRPQERLRLEYVPVDTARQWEKNPKRHDYIELMRSFKQHGFRDPAAFDAQLNGGRGGIVEGNGRSHVLSQMQGNGDEAPRGIAVDEATGVWLMPVLFGVDADSEAAAEAYGVDHNNLTLGGAGFGATDLARLWDSESYTALLADLSNKMMLPVSVEAEDVDKLIGRLAAGTGSGSSLGGGSMSGAGGSEAQAELSSGSTSSGGGDSRSAYVVVVICDSAEHQREVLDELEAEGYEVRGSAG